MSRTTDARTQCANHLTAVRIRKAGWTLFSQDNGRKQNKAHDPDDASSRLSVMKVVSWLDLHHAPGSDSLIFIQGGGGSEVDWPNYCSKTSCQVNGEPDERQKSKASHCQDTEEQIQDKPPHLKEDAVKASRDKKNEAISRLMLNVAYCRCKSDSSPVSAAHFKDTLNPLISLLALWSYRSCYFLCSRTSLDVKSNIWQKQLNWLCHSDNIPV